MLEIRWHSKTGQGAVTAAKSLATVLAKTGKQVQSFAYYTSAKRGSSMTAYNRIDDKTISNHEKYMEPDYVFVLDTNLIYTDEITANCTNKTKYIITSSISKEKLIANIPKLQSIQERVFVLDCFQIAKDTIGKKIPSTPMLGAFIKVSEISEIEYFKNTMKSVLKSLPKNLIDANILAIQRAFDEVE